MSTPFLTALSAIGSIARLWKLHETSGTSAVDASGNDRHGTYTNGPTLGEAALSLDASASSVLFDGDNDYVVQTSVGQGGANLVSPLSLICIFKSTTTDGLLVGWQRNNNSGGQYGLGIEGGKLVAAARSGSSPALYRTAASVADANDGVRHLGVAAFEARDSRYVYLDGAAAVHNDEDVGSESGTNSGRVFCVARAQNTVNGIFNESLHIAGHIEYAVMVNKLVSGTEVASLWAALQATPPSASRLLNLRRRYA